MLKQLGDYYQEAMGGKIVLTKFLNLEEIKEINSLNKDGLKVYLNGGYDAAERMRAIVQLSYYEPPTATDFKIAIYHSEYNENYGTIGHRNVLGSIMSLGIERNTFGDIYLKNQDIYLFVAEEIEKYLFSNFPLICHQQLTFTKTSEFQDFSSSDMVKKSIQVSSMRLDVILARTMNVSRNDASEIIKAGNVAIHHLECKNIDHLCHLGDIISIRKFGRITIIDNTKTTRKNRLVLEVGVNH